MRGEERESISKSDEWRVEETVDRFVFIFFTNLPFFLYTLQNTSVIDRDMVLMQIK